MMELHGDSSAPRPCPRRLHHGLASDARLLAKLTSVCEVVTSECNLLGNLINREAAIMAIANVAVLRADYVIGLPLIN